MASQTPFFLADNVFDRINLYPLGVLGWASAIPGREGNYVADYRRERTYYQADAAGANKSVRADLTGAGNIAVQPDACFIDRGHNLWGAQVTIWAQDAAAPTVSYSITRVVPALGTIGGDPTTGWCVTEEGAIYTLFTAVLTPQKYFIVEVNTSMQPVITGIILGKRHQMLNYSSVLDEDEGERDERQENSLIKGYYGRERVYTARKLRVQLATIGVTEYDTLIRGLRRLLFERDQPAFIVMNYGNKPERGWLYQYQGGTFPRPLSASIAARLS
jgi:hypothetical protein